eukprot:TRINITY_DN3736_c0_g3_i2.p1 TRINITY_DN3736_c0_g3~~TRINITY_DN3736_c0_g3_i2.p1  ORF type:complete len:533 (-),score=135.31 TRINITY_DN3736_c0_g3_i2:760-2190(-)
MKLFHLMRSSSWLKYKWPSLHVVVIACLARVRQVALAEEVVEGMQADGFSLNTTVLNALLKAYINSGWLEKGLSVLRAMEEARDPGSAPNVFSYSTVYKGLLDAGQVEKAERLFELMMEEGVFDVGTHNMRIFAFGRRGDVAGMEAAFALMQRAGVGPTHATYNSLIQGYVRADRLEEAIRTLFAKQAQGMEAQAHPYAAILKALLAKGKIDAAELVYREMEAQRCPFDDELVHALFIEAYSRSGSKAQFEECCKRIQYRDSLPVLLALLTAYTRLKAPVEAMAVVKRIGQQRNGRLANAAAANELIKLLGETGKVAEAEEVFQLMKGTTAQPQAAPMPNRINYNTLLNVYARAGLVDKMQALYQEMLEASPSVVPDTITYTTLMVGYRDRQDLASVERIFLEMEQNKCVPSLATYATLEMAYRDAREVEKAAEVRMKLESLGFELSSHKWVAKPGSDLNGNGSENGKNLEIGDGI